MKQNIAFFYLTTFLATLALTGVQYVTPSIPPYVYYNTHILLDVRELKNQDMGIELWFPMLSLVFFLLCTVMVTISERLRIFIFISALLNVLYVMYLYAALTKYATVPVYEIENGFYLHAVCSLVLLILSISKLNSPIKSKKVKVHNDILDGDF